MADVCATDFGLVAIVQNNTQMYLIQGQEIIDMSKQYGMQKYYKNDMSRTSSSGVYSDTNVRLLYDEIRKRLYITNAKHSLTFDFTINSFVGTMPYSNVSAMHKSSSSLNNAVAVVYPDEIYKTNSQEDISSGIKYFGNTYEPYIDVFVKPTDMKFAQYYSVEVEANSVGYNNDETPANYFKGSDVSSNSTNYFIVNNGGTVSVNTTNKWVRFSNVTGSGIYVTSDKLRETPDFTNSAYTISIDLYVQDVTDYLIVTIEGSGYSKAIKPIAANVWDRYYLTIPAGTSLGTITFYGSNTGGNRYLYMRKWRLEKGVTNTSGWVDDETVISNNKFKQLECPITGISVRSDYGKGSSYLFYTGEKPETNTASITKRNGRWYISMPRFIVDGNDNDLSVQQDEDSPFKVRPRMSETTFNNDRPYGNYLFVRLRFRSDVFVRVREITVTYDTKEIG